VQLVEAYCKAQGLWRLPGQEPLFTDSLALDMGRSKPAWPGPNARRTAWRWARSARPSPLHRAATQTAGQEEGRLESEGGGGVAVGNADQAGETDYSHQGQTHTLRTARGDCRDHLLHQHLQPQRDDGGRAGGEKAWKKACNANLGQSSLAPGSKVVTDYFKAAGLTPYLDQLGFDLVGYGCTTCIGNSGPLDEAIEKAIGSADLTVASVLSGNRNFEGRVHPLVKTNWLASPPLVVAYALAGSVRMDLTRIRWAPARTANRCTCAISGPASRKLPKRWPRSTRHVPQGIRRSVRRRCAVAGHRGATGRHLRLAGDSTYIQHPPFFDDIGGRRRRSPTSTARVLALLGDSVTTDHISPAGNIKADSPAGRYLREQGVEPRDFNSYGSRRGNHEVMMRGTFANIRIRNEMLGAKKAATPCTCPLARSCRSTTRPCATSRKAPRWW
jgi:aconitate hydratase